MDSAALQGLSTTQLADALLDKLRWEGISAELKPKSIDVTILAELEFKIHKILSTIRSAMNSTVPVSRLPLETLQHIFRIARWDLRTMNMLKCLRPHRELEWVWLRGEDDPVLPIKRVQISRQLAVSHVCSRWRHAAIGLSSLWATFNERVQPPRMLSELQERLRGAMVQMSAHVQLNNPIVSKLLISNAYRVNALEVSYYRESADYLIPTYGELIPCNIEPPFPKLLHLELYAPHLCLAEFNIRAEQLKTLSIANMCLAPAAKALCFPNLVQFSWSISPELYISSDEYPRVVDNAVGLLTSCSALEVLSVGQSSNRTSWTFYQDTGPSPSATYASLPKLRQIRVLSSQCVHTSQGTWSVYGRLLSRITHPPAIGIIYDNHEARPDFEVLRNKGFPRPVEIFVRLGEPGKRNFHLSMIGPSQVSGLHLKACGEFAWTRQLGCKEGLSLEDVQEVTCNMRRTLQIDVGCILEYMPALKKLTLEADVVPLHTLPDRSPFLHETLVSGICAHNVPFIRIFLRQWEDALIQELNDIAYKRKEAGRPIQNLVVEYPGRFNIPSEVQGVLEANIDSVVFRVEEEPPLFKIADACYVPDSDEFWPA